MSTGQARVPVPGSSALALHRVLDGALRLRVKNVPARPAAVGALLTRFGKDLDGMPVDMALLSALGAVRDALYVAPGREAEIRMLWQEAIATAFFAGHLARLKEMSAPAAAFAGLLHRAGEALTLQTIAESEKGFGARVDGSLRARLAAGHEAALTSALVRAWQLPASAAAAVLGWRRFGELGAVTRESMAVYFAHLLAVEMLHPEFCSPGLASALAGDMEISESQLLALRAQSDVLHRLLEQF